VASPPDAPSGSVSTPQHTLHGDQLSWLDLMLSGLVEPAFVLPSTNSRKLTATGASLPVDREVGVQAASAGAIDLLDPEGVTLATVEVSTVEAGNDNVAFVTGRVNKVSGFSHLDNLDLRATAPELHSDRAVVALWTTALSPLSLRRGAAALARDRDASLLEILPVPTGHETSHAANLAPRLARLRETVSVAHRAVVVPTPNALGWSANDLLLRATIARALGADVLAVSPRVVADLADRRDDVVGVAKSIGVDLVAIPVTDSETDLSEEELTRFLDDGAQLPDWFAEPQVAEELRRLHRPKQDAGLTVLLSGLSGSGKSTVARALAVRLLETEFRTISLLDGDVVRHHLSKGLGFARADRDTNVRRIGFVASEITKAGGIAIACPIAPYDATRRDVRAMVEEHGGFVLVHVATPLEECERRDRKGLYAKARTGEIPEFTGISDPYEVPTDAEVVIDTTGRTIEDCVDDVMRGLVTAGYVSA